MLIGKACRGVIFYDIEGDNYPVQIGSKNHEKADVFLFISGRIFHIFQIFSSEYEELSLATVLATG